jgi:hypothetical protein
LNPHLQSLRHVVTQHQEHHSFFRSTHILQQN